MIFAAAQQDEGALTGLDDGSGLTVLVFSEFLEAIAR